MEKLVNYIQTTISDSSIKTSDLEDFFTSKSLRKDQMLLPMGSVCKHYYFVNQGALRIFYFDKNGDEHTSWVAFEGYFFTEMESFTSQTALNGGRGVCKPKFRDARVSFCQKNRGYNHNLKNFHTMQSIAGR